MQPEADCSQRDLTNSRLHTFLRSIVQLLVAKDYLALERLSNAKHLGASSIEQAVSGYGRTLIMPPDDQSLPDIIAVDGQEISRWSVVVPLYSLEEGLSDLSLELSIEESEERKFQVEIENIHVR